MKDLNYITNAKDYIMYYYPAVASKQIVKSHLKTPFIQIMVVMAIIGAERLNFGKGSDWFT